MPDVIQCMSLGRVVTAVNILNSIKKHRHLDSFHIGFAIKISTKGGMTFFAKSIRTFFLIIDDASSRGAVAYQMPPQERSLSRPSRNNLTFSLEKRIVQ